MSKVKAVITAERFKEFIKVTRWYHTIDLGDGLTTAGVYDLRPFLPLHEFPASLKNCSVLDVGCSDGFYSLEFGRRNADSILSVDLNNYDGVLPLSPSPAHQDSYKDKYKYITNEYTEFADVFEAVGITTANKFCVLADYMDSKAIFRNGSVYELETLGKQFNFVFCGALMEHLKNPLLALEQLRAVTKDLCIITLSSALPASKLPHSSWRIRLAVEMLRRLGLSNEILLSSKTFPLNYVGNKSGGSFFQIHPATFREMALASGFKTVSFVNEFDIPNTRWNMNVHNAVFHCRP
jgi:2-polyprenyl-3-methyl-5-hydroxy-6-metoxy-1,4-benzoquinol methylase